MFQPQMQHMYLNLILKSKILKTGNKFINKYDRKLSTLTSVQQYLILHIFMY